MLILAFYKRVSYFGGKLHFVTVDKKLIKKKLLRDHFDREEKLCFKRNAFKTWNKKINKFYLVSIFLTLCMYIIFCETRCAKSVF